VFKGFLHGGSYARSEGGGQLGRIVNIKRFYKQIVNICCIFSKILFYCPPIIPPKLLFIFNHRRFGFLLTMTATRKFMKTVVKFAAIAIAALTLQSADASARENLCHLNFHVEKHQDPLSFDITVFLQTPQMSEPQEMTTVYNFDEEQVNPYAIATAHRTCAAANNGRLPGDAFCNKVRFVITGALTGYGQEDCNPDTSN
jgi:hypothetical protein